MRSSDFVGCNCGLCVDNVDALEISKMLDKSGGT